MGVRKRYVDVDIDGAPGQMHVMEAGEGAPFVLLHWFPLSGRMYEAELPVLAELGWRAIAPDIIGHGRSDPRAPGWTVERHAGAVCAALAELGVQAPVILGGHMTSQIAVEAASRAETGARAVVLDGGPFVEEAALQAIFEKMSRVQGGLIPQDDDSHRDFLWARAVNTYEIFSPGFEVAAETLPLVYRLISDFLATHLASGQEVVADTPPGYPMAEKMAGLTAPGVLVTSESEPLRTSFEPMCEAYGGQTARHIFPGGHPLHDPGRVGEFARAIDAKLGELGVASS